MKRLFLFCISIIIFTIVLNAQSDDNCLGKAVVSCPAEYVPNQRFTYLLTIPSKGDFTVLPNFGKLTPVYGPSIRAKHSTHMVDGHVTESDTICHSWTVIAYQEGDYEIPSFKVRSQDNDKFFTVPSHTISINRNAKIQKDKDESTSAVEQSRDYANDIIFQWKVEHQEPICVGNDVDCYLELIFGSNISQVSDYNFPIPRNVYVTPIDADNAITHKDTLINNSKYRYSVLTRFKITPLSAGDLVLPEVSATVDVYKSSGNTLDDFFNGGATYEKMTIKAKPTPIKVNKGTLSDISPVNLNNCGLLVCCDVSSSMQVLDNGTKRSIVTKRFVEEIESKLPTDASIQYIAFAGGIEKDYSDDIKLYLDTISYPKNDGTALHDAILYPLATLKNFKDIVLLTDGLDNHSHVGMETTMDILKQHGIRLHVVYVNSMADSVTVNVYEQPDTLGDGIVSEGHYIPYKYLNEKLNEDQISIWKRNIKPLGGQFYILKKEDDIQSVANCIIKNISEDANVPTKKYKQEQININNYILHRMMKEQIGR